MSYPEDEDWFRPGDVVTRDGSDRHVVVSTNERIGDPYPPDLITVRCIVAPASGWCSVGEQEANIPGRYELVARGEDVVDPLAL